LYPIGASEFIQNLELPFIMHFRAASTGMSKSNLLCHPFEVTNESLLKLEGQAQQLLIHNGTLSGWKILLAACDIPDPIYMESSDTRALSIVLAKLSEWEKQKRLLRMLQGRFVFINANDTEKPFKVFGIFSDDKDYPGMKFSNLEWQWYSSNKSYLGVDNHWENDYTNNNHNNSNILPTLVEKTIDEVEKMNPDQKLAYERHLNYHKMLEKGEKFHCHRCGFELSR
jgi:hypothetical protein